ncbi:MAG: EAL domain-containing protein [Georgfuchsia sp.]
MDKIGDQGFDKIIRSFLEGFSLYVVPIGIAVMTLVTLFILGNQYSVDDGVKLTVNVIKDESAQGLSPAQALRQLAATQPEEYHDTHLAEEPFWFSFKIPASDRDEPIIEFPSRHAIDISCWNAATLVPLGQASRTDTVGSIFLAGSGFAIAGAHMINTTLLCRAHFSGPARLSTTIRGQTHFLKAVQRFSRDSGLIDGGLGILALFVFITAIINREWIYVLFAVWLVSNLRLAALSAGWDVQWLGQPVPADWLPLMRKLNISIYYVLTVTLFGQLFSNDLKRLGYQWLRRWSWWSCLPMLAAVALSYRHYLPLMWVMTGITGSIIVFLLVRILLVTRSRVAIWFSVSLAIALLSGFSEVIAAALSMKGAIGVVNSVTAALFSSLIAALAISQQMRDEKIERRRAENALRSTYQEIPIGLFTLDHAGCIVRANPTLGEMLGDVIHDGAHFWADYFGSKSWKRLLKEVHAGSAVEMELRDIHVVDAEQWYLMRAKRVGDQIEGSLQDISERVKATEKLKFLADHDSLTGALNRRGLEQALSQTSTAITADQSYSLAYLDLDRFKLINDLYGHTAGDEVLRQICRRIESELAGGGYFGRVGGDEFVIVFRQAKLNVAAESCRRLIGAIKDCPFQIADKAFRVGGCIGLVDVRADIAVPDAIASADQACQEAKKGSGSRLIVYEQESPAFNEREHELHILKLFSVDAPPEGLFLVMQPIMSLHAPYDALNFEVLLRMRRPDNSIESAVRIITAAEKNGRIAMIDRWVVRNVLEWIDTNFDALNRTRFVSVNLSGGSLNDERFIEDIFSMVAEHPHAVSRICFEITESVAVSDIDNTLRFVNRIRDFGAKVALDDFGVGYTSFSYLHSLSADVLKIDGSLVRDALAHPANMSIIEAIANLSSNLGMSSIAEWAEDLDTIKAMQEVGITYIQSYAIARPQMPESILAAKSSADFIQDPLIEEYVKKYLAGGADDLLIWRGDQRKQDMH